MNINKKLSFCQVCAIDKNHSLLFSPSTSIYTAPLQLILFNLLAPAYKISRNGYKYYISFIDVYSRYTWLYFLESKSQAFAAFIQLKLMLKNCWDLRFFLFNLMGEGNLNLSHLISNKIELNIGFHVLTPLSKMVSRRGNIVT